MRDRRQQLLCIGILRIAQDAASAVPCSTMRPAAHHDDAVAQQAHHVEIVRHEQIAHAHRLLEVLQQVEHHRLHRDVERRGRLVEDDELWVQRDGARDADTRLLAAGELMRKAVQQIDRQADQPSPAPRSGRAARRALMSPSCRIGSAMARAAVKRGLRLSVGSWNTIWMLAAQRQPREGLRQDGADVLAVEQ